MAVMKIFVAMACLNHTRTSRPQTRAALETVTELQPESMSGGGHALTIGKGVGGVHSLTRGTSSNARRRGRVRYVGHAASGAVRHVMYQRYSSDAPVEWTGGAAPVPIFSSLLNCRTSILWYTAEDNQM